MTNINIHSCSTVNPDSIEIGKMSTGVVKIYLDFDNPEDCKRKIDNAAEIRKYASIKLTPLNGG